MSQPDVIRIEPGAVAGTIVAPGDKSLSHRALILAALCEDPVEVSGVSVAGDVASTAACLRQLGAHVDLREAQSGRLSGTVAGAVGEASHPLDCGNAGTGMRLLAGVAAGIAGLTVLTGDDSLSRRPMDRVAVPLREMGASVDGRGPRLQPPLVVRGGQLHGVEYASPVASAQVKSCVLLAGLRADGPTVVTSPLPSRDHTERMLAHLGVAVTREVDEDGTERVAMTPGPLRGVAIDVTGDPSGAAFWLVAAAVAGTDVTVRDVCVNPGRVGFVEALEALGAEVAMSSRREVAGEPVADLTIGGASLHGSADLRGRTVVDSIDELPILALAGAMSIGGLQVRDAAELRVKESDRIDAIARTLSALGLDIETTADGFSVPGGQRPDGGEVDARGDHRIAMLAAVAGTVATGPVTIRGFATVPTSYPAFLDDLSRLGGRCTVLETLP